VPDGYTEVQRGRPGGFAGDPDIMDTWATSSLTPFLVCGWESDPDLWKRTFPMDLRPQAHDIIRTWLFSTVLRSHLEEGVLPWQHAAISGWVLDPDRKKMSKSKGNVVTPMGLLDEHGSDAVRYWAAKGGPGVDTAFEPGQMQVGRRLAIKLLNASKFVLGRSTPVGAVTEPLDRGLLKRLAALVDGSTRGLAEYDYASALRDTESFFWSFCDDYIELVKRRRAGEDAAAASANTAARLTLDVLVRLFAPFLPFVTEEVWSWSHDSSVHRAAWPTRGEIDRICPHVSDADEHAILRASEITALVRHQRSLKKLGFGKPVRAAFRLSEDLHAPVWPRIRLDVLAGNNVVEDDVRFGSGEASVEIEPVVADA
jgi:valyl-tRNA synthetase